MQSTEMALCRFRLPQNTGQQPPFWVTDAIVPSIIVDWRDFDGNRGQKWRTDLPQSVAKLTATNAVKKVWNWKQPESRIQSIIKMYGATTGPIRKSYRYDFEAMSEVSKTDCDGHMYIHTYKHSAT